MTKLEIVCNMSDLTKIHFGIFVINCIPYSVSNTKYTVFTRMTTVESLRHGTTY